jgi:predicted nucleic acid-binding protein
VTVFVDPSILVSHLIGEPDHLARASTAWIADGELMLVSDLVLAETIRLLETVFDVDRHLIATATRSLLVHDATVAVDIDVLLRAISIYEIDGLTFPAAHLVALAESTGVTRIASFDRRFDRSTTVRRIDPSEAA